MSNHLMDTWILNIIFVSENKSRLFMMVYRDGNMFQDSSAPMNVDQAPLDSASLNRKRLNSFVISASIGGRKIEGLQQKVKTIFRPIKVTFAMIKIEIFEDDFF